MGRAIAVQPGTAFQNFEILKMGLRWICFGCNTSVMDKLTVLSERQFYMVCDACHNELRGVEKEYPVELQAPIADAVAQLDNWGLSPTSDNVRDALNNFGYEVARCS